MVNKKISELDPAATITGTETVPLLQAGATKAATVAQLLASVLGTNPVAGLSTLKQLADAIGDDPTYAADLITTLATKAPAMTATAVKTAAYTAAAGEIVPVDATAGAVPIALPATPADRARVTVKKIDASTNPVTITVGGTDVFNKAGGSTSASLTLLNQSTTVQYTAAAGIWYVIAADTPLTQLDSRYTTPAAVTTVTAPLTAAAAARYPQGAAFIRKLKQAYLPAAVGLLGDSTGDGDTEWFRLFVNWIAPLFPAYTVTYRTFDDPTQAYLPETVIQVGTAGDRSIRNPTTGTYFTTPDSVVTSITGDIDIRVKAALDTWTPAAAMPLAGKFGGAGLRSWRIEMNTNGTIQLGTSSDGTNTPGASSSLPVPFTAGQTGWVRATLDVDNGAGGNTATFYTSTDGTTWTQLGATTNVGGAPTAIFDSTQTTQFIGRGGGGNSIPATFYRLQVFSGLGAAAVPVIDFDLDVLPFGGVGALTVTDYTGNVWTLAGSTDTRAGAPGLAFFNGSVGGKSISYGSDPTRFPKLFPYPTDLAFVSYSHNEAGALIAYRPSYKTLTDAILARFPDAGIVTTSQNPRMNPAPNIIDHAIRGQQIGNFAASQGWPFLDIQTVFATAGVPLTTLINNTDGIHPLDAGSQLWFGQVRALVQAWI